MHLLLYALDLAQIGLEGQCALWDHVVNEPLPVLENSLEESPV